MHVENGIQKRKMQMSKYLKEALFGGCEHPHPLPTHPNSISIASILPLAYWISPSLSFSTNSQTPQTPKS